MGGSMTQPQFGETPEITAAKKRLDEGLARYVDEESAEYKKWKARRRKQPAYLLFNKEKS